MKSILIPFSGSDSSRIALDTALVVGRRFGSYIEGLFVYQVPPIIAGEGITLPGDYMTQLGEENRALARKARDAFDQALTERGIPVGRVEDVDGVCAGWMETEATLTQAIGEHGRLFDLILVARDTQPTVDWKAACETAMFETGRPVIVAGRHAAPQLGRRIVVSWNGSTETARTLAMAHPFLSAAEWIVVVTVESGTVSGPTGEEAARHLARHGMNVRAETIDENGCSVGEAVLRYARDNDVDLIVKGAFTHSRLRQMIFGGATNEILNNATIPVLFCH